MDSTGINIMLIASALPASRGGAMLSFPRAVHSNSYNWMVGAITTVVGEHKRLVALAAARICN